MGLHLRLPVHLRGRPRLACEDIVSGHCEHCVNFGRNCQPKAPDWWHRTVDGAWPNGQCPFCKAAKDERERIAKWCDEEAEREYRLNSPRGYLTTDDGARAYERCAEFVRGEL